MRLLRGVPVRLVVIGLPGPVPIRSGSPRGLPVLVHIVARRARGLRLRRARHRLANSADRQCCLPTVRTGSAPGSMFSQLDTLPTGTSVYASPAASRRPTQDSRPGWSRCSFPVGLFHPLQYAGLSRRSLTPFPPHFPPVRGAVSNGCPYRDSLFSPNSAHEGILSALPRKKRLLTPLLTPLPFIL